MDDLREAEVGEVLQAAQARIRQENSLVVGDRVVGIGVVGQVVDVGNPCGNLRVRTQREVEAESADADLVEAREQTAAKGGSDDDIAYVDRGRAVEEVAQVEARRAGGLVLQRQADGQR